MPPKQKKQDETPTPAAPVEIEAPSENPDSVVSDVTADEVVDAADHTMLEFRQTGPNYDVNILDSLISKGRGDLILPRTNIAIALNEADNRSEAVKQFKDDFDTKSVLNMPILNEAVNNGQVTARDLRGELWKIIKSLPHS